MLAPHAQDESELDALLDDLERCGWLSEKRLVEQVVHTRRDRWGSRAIASALREKGVSEATVEEATRALKKDDVKAAREVWRKRFGEPPRDAKDRARQIRFLQSRGFDLDVIRRVLRGVDGDNAD